MNPSILRSDLALGMKVSLPWIVKATAMTHLQVNLTLQRARWMTLNLISILIRVYRRKGLRIGHWIVNHLASSKFDQIKLFLKNKDGTPQVDVLWLNETFKKPDIPDSLYSVPGFTIFRRDRRIKNGGGILAFVNDELSSIRRTDLEDSNLEILWLEIAPFKSKRSLLLAGIYRPPSSTRADDITLENNIEN